MKTSQSLIGINSSFLEQNNAKNKKREKIRVATFQGKGKIEVKEVADPTIQNPDEAIVRVAYS